VAKRLIKSGCSLGVSVDGRRMGVLYGVEIIEGEGAVFGGEFGRPIVTNEVFVA